MLYLKQRIRTYVTLATFLIIFASCKKSNGGQTTPTPPSPPPTQVTSTITINRSQKFQTIDGFGFFGAKSVWWDNAPNLYSDAWATQVINDLGITIWRNELYPPSTPSAGQDADWNKQKPVVEGLNNIAIANRVPLKFIFTVWSPRQI